MAIRAPRTYLRSAGLVSLAPSEQPHTLESSRTNDYKPADRSVGPGIRRRRFPLALSLAHARRGLIGVAAGILVFAGACSPDKARSVHDFLFEAPASRPADDARPPSQTLSQPLTAVQPRWRFASIHPPFAARRCGECHDASRSRELFYPWSQRCASCHAPIFAPQTYMHGPVAAAACNECHLPHVSALPRLLRRSDPDLCLACHGNTFVASTTYHPPSVVGCTPCHEPHAAPNRRFLKPYETWRSLAPDYRPTSQPTRGDAAP